MSYRGGRAVQPPSSTNPRGVNAMGPRNTQKQKGTAVISIDELDRIRRQVVETKADSYETQRNLARQNLQQTSKARVSNWSNTMEAQRMKREEDRIKKLEDAEVSTDLASSTISWVSDKRAMGLLASDEQSLSASDLLFHGRIT